MMQNEENEGGKLVQSRAMQNSDLYLTEEEEAERKDLEEQRLISRINWDNLSVSQRELLAQRYTLIKYLDRLQTYTEIDSDDFDTDFYVGFRDQSTLEAAIQFAHSGKTRAVATLLERYPSDLEEYKLCILSNFPESLNPQEYADLIPSMEDLLQPQEEISETKDWIDYQFIKVSPYELHSAVKIPNFSIFSLAEVTTEKQNGDCFCYCLVATPLSFLRMP